HTRAVSGTRGITSVNRWIATALRVRRTAAHPDSGVKAQVTRGDARTAQLPPPERSALSCGYLLDICAASGDTSKESEGSWDGISRESLLRTIDLMYTSTISCCRRRSFRVVRRPLIRDRGNFSLPQFSRHCKRRRRIFPSAPPCFWIFADHPAYPGMKVSEMRI